MTILSGFVIFMVLSKCKSQLLEDCVPTENTIFTFNNLKPAHSPPYIWHPWDGPEQREPAFLAEKLRLQGRSYAGRSEFPYLVDVRFGPTEKWENQEQWANGNLVTGKYVLTVCDAIVDWKEASGGDTSFAPGATGTEVAGSIGTRNHYMILKAAQNFTIMYAAEYHYVTTVGREDEVGTRKVEAVYPHPKCNYFVLDYSTGILVIKDQPINPYPPYTAFMELDPDCTAYQYWKLKWNNYESKAERNHPYHTCYVGFWGRKIFGDDKFTTKSGPQPEGAEFQYNELHNHKVRYAVRVVDPALCFQWRYSFPERFYHWVDYKDNFECMKIHENETVGTICNHARGAPVVCGGTVRAIVLAGVTDHCDNNVMFPFLVIDARFILPMYANIKKSLFKNLTKLGTSSGEKKSEGVRLHSPLNACWLFFVLILNFIYLINILS